MKHIEDRLVWQLLIDAQETGEIHQIMEQLTVVEQTIGHDGTFHQLLNGPSMSESEKKQFIIDCFEPVVHSVIVSFLVALLSQKKMDRLPVMVQTAKMTLARYLKELDHVVSGTIYAAIPVTDSQKKTMESVFSDRLKINVMLSVVIDETLIGGYKVVIGDEIYDHTIKSQLQQLRETMEKDIRESL